MDENTFFREVTLRISGDLEIEVALQDAFDFISGVIPADTMGLYFIDLDEELICSVARVGRHRKPAGFEELAPLSALGEEMVSRTHAMRDASIFNSGSSSYVSSRLIRFRAARARFISTL